MTEPADPDGMFTNPQPADWLVSIVTCTVCGCVVVDTDAHMRSHSIWSLPDDAPIRVRQADHWGSGQISPATGVDEARELAAQAFDHLANEIQGEPI
jgi:hypothetical protein